MFVRQAKIHISNYSYKLNEYEISLKTSIALNFDLHKEFNFFLKKK